MFSDKILYSGGFEPATEIEKGKVELDFGKFWYNIFDFEIFIFFENRGFDWKIFQVERIRLHNLFMVPALCESL